MTMDRRHDYRRHQPCNHCGQRRPGASDVDLCDVCAGRMSLKDVTRLAGSVAAARGVLALAEAAREREMIALARSGARD